MSLAEFSQNIHGFMGNSFANSFQTKQYLPWKTNTSYTLGNVVLSNNGKYVATSTGTSGVSSPSHTTGAMSDGGVSWLFIENVLKSNNFQNNLYIFSGRLEAWVDEHNPPEPVNTDKEEFDTFANIIALKKISSDEIKMGIKRVDWTSGTVYAQYDNTKKPFVNVLPGETAGYDTDFYVLVQNQFIYKCIDNNNGAPSVSAPPSTNLSTSLVNTGDGYVWKFMGEVGIADSSRFLTSSFIPVEYKTTDDNSVQWRVQIEAANNVKGISSFKVCSSKGNWAGITAKTTIVQPTGSNPGSGCVISVHKSVDGSAISRLLVTNPGSNYEPDAYVLVSDNSVSNGSGATAEVSGLSSQGVISSVSVINSGSNYTASATALVFDRAGSGSGAILNTTVSGSVVTTISVTAGGSGYIDPVVVVVPGGVGAVATAVTSPLKGHGSNIVTELGANLAIISCHINNNDYFLYGSSNKFRQIGVITDIIDNSTNSYAIDQHYIGPAHPQYNNVGSALKKIKKNTGNLLYLNNTTAVVRSVDQEEHLKISVAF